MPAVFPGSFTAAMLRLCGGSAVRESSSGRESFRIWKADETPRRVILIKKKIKDLRQFVKSYLISVSLKRGILEECIEQLETKYF